METIFTDENIINFEDYIPKEEYNPYNIRPFEFQGDFYIGIVFADCLREAFDILADSGKLDYCKVVNEDEPLDEDVYSNRVCLGNYCHFYEIEGITCKELQVTRLVFESIEID